MINSDHIMQYRLARTKNIGPITYHKLKQRFNTVHDMAHYIEHSKNIPLYNAAKAKEEIEKTYAFGADIIFHGSPDYPSSLNHLVDAPIMLTIIGHKHLLHKPTIAIVGARNVSNSGRALSTRFAEKLGEMGFVICSGLARGVDGAAHQGALKTGTIGVIAGGINNIYPKQHHMLYSHIKETGLLISESFFDQAPMAQSFPKRNRIIAGLSSGVLLIEAALKSGTLITANCALEQGKEVFAVPGSPVDKRARGCNMLIKQGAILTETPDDIMDNLPHYTLLKEHDSTDKFDKLDSTAIPIVEEVFSDNDIKQAKEQLLSFLSSTPTRLETILRDSTIGHNLLYYVLVECELDGDISYCPPCHYILQAKRHNDGALHGLF